MTYLLSLPFRFIKLEKEIVWECFKSEKAHIAIESTVAMIKKLNMQIVAGGIEDKHQLDTLLGMGCDFIQGYYFSKPVPEKDFIEVALASLCASVSAQKSADRKAARAAQKSITGHWMPACTIRP